MNVLQHVNISNVHLNNDKQFEIYIFINSNWHVCFNISISTVQHLNISFVLSKQKKQAHFKITGFRISKEKQTKQISFAKQNKTQIVIVRFQNFKKHNFNI